MALPPVLINDEAGQWVCKKMLKEYRELYFAWNCSQAFLQNAILKLFRDNLDILRGEQDDFYLLRYR